ncbi:MAG: hypothetical protein WA628_08800 [Terriglobales bacterium]
MRCMPVLPALLLLLGKLATGQQPQVPPPERQIAAAVLPLPPSMREHATVLGYAPDLTLVTLRQGSNGMVCTATRPGDAEFDVRCYHESFMPLVRRLRDLDAQGVKLDEIYRLVDAEVKSRKLAIPDHPTAGYRMLGPISAYTAATNTTSHDIESWQSVHFPYKTAAEIGLPEEGEVTGTMPYVMASGTFWSHVMIVHEGETGQK